MWILKSVDYHGNNKTERYDDYKQAKAYEKVAKQLGYKTTLDFVEE